jgi:hypothetical protein
VPFTWVERQSAAILCSTQASALGREDLTERNAQRLGFVERRGSAVGPVASGAGAPAQAGKRCNCGTRDGGGEEQTRECFHEANVAASNIRYSRTVPVSRVRYDRWGLKGEVVNSLALQDYAGNRRNS